MAETKDAHIVEIPVDEEHQQKLISATSTISAIQNHPLAEISQSPGHFLLLKLWQREEDLFGRRMSRKESRKDTIGREIFQLCCFFFVFHGLFFTILFTSSSSSSGDHQCKKWWIPSVLSACTSLVIVFLVQVKLCRYWKVERQLQRDRAEGRALTRCIQELRMKGASFDLSKEPQNGKRLKSSSVEIKWRPLTWCSQYRVTVFLVCFTGKRKKLKQTARNGLSPSLTRNEALLVRLFYSVHEITMQKNMCISSTTRRLVSTSSLSDFIWQFHCGFSY